MIKREIALVNCAMTGCCSSPGFSTDGRGHGLHSSPSAGLVHLAAKFESRIQVEYGNEVSDAKSILGILCLTAGVRSIVTIRCDGTDEKPAMEAIVDFLTRGAGELLCLDYEAFLSTNFTGSVHGEIPIKDYTRYVQLNPECPFRKGSNGG